MSWTNLHPQSLRSSRFYQGTLCPLSFQCDRVDSLATYKGSVKNRPVRLDLSAESAAIQQCFSLTTNQRTVDSLATYKGSVKNSMCPVRSFLMVTWIDLSCLSE
jgi:hypothetical protein